MEEKEEKVKIAKVAYRNRILVSCLILITVVVSCAFLEYKYQHTFSVSKWAEFTNERINFVDDMLKQTELIGMSEIDVIAILGREDAKGSNQTSFKGDYKYYNPNDTLVYYLGSSGMEGCWLIISLENDVVRSYCLGIT